MSATLTRQHFAMIADALRLVRPDPGCRPEVAEQFTLCCATIADRVLKASNPRFSEHTFLTACGLSVLKYGPEE